MFAVPDVVVPLALAAAGVAAIVWGAERFAENLSRASTRLGVSRFALALLLAGAEPEELATAVAATVRDAPAIAFGDVIGANVAICLVALGVGALVAPLPFGTRVMRYGMLGLPVGVIAVAFAWDGRVGRIEGAVLVGLYVAFVATIWFVEREVPTIGEVGEVGELDEAGEEIGSEASHGRTGRVGRVGRELILVLVGLTAMVVGATLLVDGVRELVEAEADQTRLSLTVVGFATAFELVVLAWSGARRGITDAVVAGVVGSYGYNVTMTLGAAAVVRPLALADAGQLHLPMAMMLLALAACLALASRHRALHRRHGTVLLAGYPVFVIAVLI
ncbi:MAG: sodium:calcium antiporter [Acidimicrobiia bacterium]|nr:sodium:calcium antiporter [Acidimicrobiia bacterium]